MAVLQFECCRKFSYAAAKELDGEWTCAAEVMKNQGDCKKIESSAQSGSLLWRCYRRPHIISPWHERLTI
jgi:hypothetical protein